MDQVRKVGENSSPNSPPPHRNGIHETAENEVYAQKNNWYERAACVMYATCGMTHARHDTTPTALRSCCGSSSRSCRSHDPSLTSRMCLMMAPPFPMTAPILQFGINTRETVSIPRLASPPPNPMPQLPGDPTNIGSPSGPTMRCSGLRRGPPPPAPFGGRGRIEGGGPLPAPTGPPRGLGTPRCCC